MQHFGFGSGFGFGGRRCENRELDALGICVLSLEISSLELAYMTASQALVFWEMCSMLGGSSLALAVAAIGE